MVGWEGARLTMCSYKPNPAVYLGAAERLGLRPEECCMVAAHLSDLEAARGCGFKTVYVERSREEAWDMEKVAQTKKEGWVDIWVTENEKGFLTVAERLGVK
jgi:2-haloacid dehalogenase